MYKPYSGVDYTVPTSHWNIKCFSYFLKDLFSCLAATMPSKNHLFSLLRNASLICVYEFSCPPHVSRRLRGSIISSFQFVSIYRLFTLFSFKAHLPRFKFIWHFLECFQSNFSIVKGPAFCRQHTEIFWLVRGAVMCALHVNWENVSRNKMTNFVWERVTHLLTHTKLLPTCLPHIITCSETRHPQKTSTSPTDAV